ASRELDTLLKRAPSFAQRINPHSGELERIPVGQVSVGDELVILSAEVIPVDGILISERAVIDESSVTGEPLPATYSTGELLISGTVNSTESFSMRATKTASDSHYASIVALVETAVQSRAPLVRLA